MKRKQKIVAIVLLASAVLVAAALTAAAAQNKGPIVPKKKIVLFNGKDFTGWKLFIPKKEGVAPKTVWSIKDGVIRCKGKPHGYIRTEADYADYIIHVEWRWTARPGNSGVLVQMQLPDKVWPKCIECQLESGNAGDFWLVGKTEIDGHRNYSEQFYNVKKLKPASEKTPGEWNTYEIICRDGCIVPIVNGVIQNVATGASVTSGKICLQSEGAPIEFRNIYLEPAVKNK